MIVYNIVQRLLNHGPYLDTWTDESEQSTPPSQRGATPPPQQTETSTEIILDEFDAMLGKFDEELEQSERDNNNPGRCEGEGKKRVRAGHQKQDSDCTIVNLDVSRGGPETDKTPQGSPAPEKRTLKGLFSALKLHTLQREEEEEGRTEEEEEEEEEEEDGEEEPERTEEVLTPPGDDLLSNFVTFIRTNSMRLKKSLNKGEPRRISPVPISPTSPTSPALHNTPSQGEEVEQESGDFAELCRPVHGLLRRSESGPITFHRRVPVTRTRLRHTFPGRLKSVEGGADSGFESCTSSTLPRAPSRRKCLVPVSVRRAVHRTSPAHDTTLDRGFNFMEGQCSSLDMSIEAMIPALHDISDDEDGTDRTEMFFGKFPGFPKIPLRKAVVEPYQSQSQAITFSDEEGEDEDEEEEGEAGRSTHISSSNSGSSKRSLELFFSRSSTEDIIISPLPGDQEDLSSLFSESLDTAAMICEGNSDKRVLTGRLVVWTPDYKQKVKKVYLARQRAGSVTPENSVKLLPKENGEWSICTNTERKEGTLASIVLTVETDTERSESVSTNATSPFNEQDQGESAALDTDEELYLSIREEMRTLDGSSDHTPNQVELPWSVIDYENR